MGILAHRWRQLQFDNGRASNFAQIVAEPVRTFCAQTIDISAGLAGLLVPFKTAGDFLADRYQNDLFGDTMIKDLPVADGIGNPKFIFYATNLTQLAAIVALRVIRGRRPVAAAAADLARPHPRPHRDLPGAGGVGR